MLRRAHAPVLVSALFIAACGGESPEPERAMGSGGSVSSGSGGEAGSLVQSGGTGGVTAEVLYASFIAETAVGESPALVSFQNDTSFLMSLWVEQAEFLAIPSGTHTAPELAASDAIQEDSSTGQCKKNACVKSPIMKFTGPSVLEPGESYSMSIALDPALGFVATLTQVPTRSFVGVRAKVFDDTSDSFKPSQLDLNVQGARSDVRLRFTTYDQNRTNYKPAGAGELGVKVGFLAGSGQRYEASELVSLSSAPGFTVVIDDEPVPGAAALAKLERSLE